MLKGIILDVIPWSKVPRSNVLECIDKTRCQFLNKSSKLAKVPIVRETRTKTQNSWFFNLPLKNVFVAITINPNPWRLIISPLHQMTVIFCGSWSGPTKQHSEEVLLNTIFYFNVQTTGLLFNSQIRTEVRLNLSYKPLGGNHSWRTGYYSVLKTLPLIELKYWQGFQGQGKVKGNHCLIYFSSLTRGRRNYLISLFDRLSFDSDFI